MTLAFIYSFLTVSECFADCFMFVVMIAGLGVQASVDTKVHCLSCKMIGRPEDCRNVIMCSPGEICGTDKYVTKENKILYDLDCKDVAICTSSSHMISSVEISRQQKTNTIYVPTGRKRQIMAASTCHECCVTDFCNNVLCGRNAGAVECLGCNEIANIDHCRNVEVCDLHEVCYMEEALTDQLQIRFNGGCLRDEQCNAYLQAQQTQDNTLYSSCFICCGESFCNRQCASDIRTTISTQTATTLASSTISTTQTSTSTRSTTTDCPALRPSVKISPPTLRTDMLSTVGCGGQDDIMFLADSSEYINGFEEQGIMLFITSLANIFNMGQNKTRLGYVTYNRHINPVIGFNRGVNQRRTLRHLNNLLHQQHITCLDACLGCAMEYALTQLSEPHLPSAKQFIVIFTQDTIANITDAVHQATIAKTHGIEIFVLGAGQFMSNLEDMKKIVSSPTDTHLLRMDYFEELGGVLEDVILGHCKENGPQPRSPCSTPNIISPGCKTKEEIILILDQSAHTLPSDLHLIKLFINKFVKDLTISPASSSIGILSFNSSVTELLHLSTFNDSTTLTQLINTKFNELDTSGKSFMHLALARALEWYDDSNINKVAIVFTNGGYLWKSETIAAALDLHRNDVRVYVVSLGRHVDLKDQMILATDQDERHILSLNDVDYLLAQLKVTCSEHP